MISVRGADVLIDKIEIPETARSCNEEVVVELSKSISVIGLQSAPTVVERDGRFVLVSGRHRLEALKRLGIDNVRARVVDLDDIEARMWTISENLHRAELSVTQRSEQVAEWIRLTEEKGEAERAQIAQNESKREDGRGHRYEGGDSLAARELGISRDEVRRARIIVGLPEETKEAARDLSLDDNQSALLKAAKVSTPGTQIAVLHHIADRGRVAEDRPPPPTSADDYGSPTPTRSSSGWVEPFVTTRLPIKITYPDIQAWLLEASDIERRHLSDEAFIVIDSDAERLKHGEVFMTWLTAHERKERA